MLNYFLRWVVLKSALLNTLSLIVIYTFDILFLPILGRSTQERWLHRNIGSLYQVLFQLPVVGMSLYLNVSSLAHPRAACSSPIWILEYVG